LLTLVASGSSEAQRDTSAKAPASVVIQGRIVGADTLAGVPDVTVTLRQIDDLPLAPLIGAERHGGSPIATARSGPDGTFELAGVSAGRYRLFADPGVTALKYLPARMPDPAVDESEPLSVATDRPPDLLVITLPRAAAITGQVVDGNGSPVALVAVRALEVLSGDRSYGATTTPGAAARTDDNGAFRIFGLRPGEYLVSAQGMPQGPMRTEPTPGSTVPFVSAPTTYYPGTASAREATLIRVTAGQEYGPLTFPLYPVPLWTVRAFVMDPQGQPASTVSVSLRAVVPAAAGVTVTLGYSASRTTNSDGTVEFLRVPAGEYTATVTHYSMGSALFAWVPVTVAGDVDSVSIRLKPGTSVSGRVVMEGQPPARLPSMYVRAVSARPPGATTSPALVEPDLSFAIREQFGPAFIRTDAVAGWHLKSVLLGGADITDRAVEFAPDGPSVDVVLTQRAATLAGLVTTATGRLIDASVRLINEDPSAWHTGATTTRTTTTGADGKYRFEGLRAGRYLVVATPRDDGLGPGQSSDYFELLARHATRVVIGEGTNTALDLKRNRLR
jgi:protocatechuate 3,4-dioxygenase beta subunit